jgi:ATPase family protein associated with various cellular activities (AAA)/AAA+ lid domain-containing protein
MKTRSEIVAAEIVAKLRARTPVMWIVTKEEARVERYLFEAAAAASFVPYFWDIAAGVTDINGKTMTIGGQDPDETFNAILARHRETDKGKQERGVWIMRDLPVWLAGPPGAAPLRKLRNFARAFPAARESAQAIIIVSPNGDVPPELADHATVIDWPMPDREEIASIIDVLIEQYDLKDLLKNGNRDRAIDAAIGLSGEEAQACYSRSLVQSRTIDPLMVAKEKKRIIARERVLEWYDPIPDGLNAIGGLDNLKAWLISRSAAFTADARAYGLPRPKGTMLVGISGCGKSLTAKAISTAWQCPLLRVDLGALKSKFVGESEQNLRKVFKVIEALGFCVVWFDEVEKALQGATSGSADGGVSSDAMGAVLTWMQERTSDAFVIMTANDISALPPEFLRKGRFDELWWIDLPTATERVAVLNAAMRANGRGKIKVDAVKVAKACEGFTGSEIAAIVPDALFAAFSDNKREITTDDLIEAAKTVVPLSKTADKKISGMRAMAKGRFRPATKAEDEVKGKGPTLRVLDIG